MKKILVVCGNGLGSSFMVEMLLKEVISEMGFDAEVNHTDLTSAKSETADLFIGDTSLVASLIDGDRNVQGLTNMMSKDELRKAIATTFDL